MFVSTINNFSKLKIYRVGESGEDGHMVRKLKRRNTHTYMYTVLLGLVTLIFVTGIGVYANKL